MTRRVKVFSPRENFPNFCTPASPKLAIVIGRQVRYGQPMTDKPQVIAIAHVPSGEELKVEIGGPPFPRSLPGSMFPYPMREFTFTVWHRPGQDPASLEQHYDSDTGSAAFREEYGL